MKKLSVYEVAESLGVTHSTIYNWIKRGLPHEVEYQGIRPTIKLDLEEVKEWVKNVTGRGN